MLSVSGKLASKHRHSFPSRALEAGQWTSGRIVRLACYALMDVALPPSDAA